TEQLAYDRISDPDHNRHQGYRNYYNPGEHRCLLARGPNYPTQLRPYLTEEARDPFKSVAHGDHAPSHLPYKKRKPAEKLAHSQPRRDYIWTRLRRQAE